MTQEDKRAYNYARDRLANDDYPVYSDEYELELAYKEGIEDAKNHPHWISVEDELPKDDVYVATINKFGLQEVRYYSRGKWYCNFGNEYGSITHWMPLPQPPKKGGEE